MFHHGYLREDEYHFKDISDVRLSITARDTKDPKVSLLCVTDEPVDLHVTSRAIYATMKKPRTLKQSELFTSADTTKEMEIPIMVRFYFSKMSILSAEPDFTFSVEIIEEFMGYFKHHPVRSQSYQITIKNNSHNKELVELAKKNIKIRGKLSFNKKEKLKKLIDEYEKTSVEAISKRYEHGFKTLLSCIGTHVTLHFRTRSLVQVTTEAISIQSLSNDRDVLNIPMRDVLRITKKPWRYYDGAIEIYFNATSVFISLDSAKERDTLFDLVLAHSQAENLSISDYQRMWHDRTLTNYQYLSIVNDYAGRTVHDICQYHIFPWIIQDYESDAMDFTRETTFRDLSKTTRNITPVKFELSNRKNKKSQLTDHYSNPVDVLRFLQRKYPYLVLPNSHVNKGAFDGPLAEWNSITKEEGFWNEVIPDLYSLDTSFISRKTGLPAVKLPKWASNKLEFLSIFNISLENRANDESIHLWIDAVFGVDQDNLGEEITTHNSPKPKMPNGMETKCYLPLRVFNEKHLKRKLSDETILMQQLKEEYENMIQRMKQAHAEEIEEYRTSALRTPNTNEDLEHQSQKKQIEELVKQGEESNKAIAERDSLISQLRDTIKQINSEKDERISGSTLDTVPLEQYQKLSVELQSTQKLIKEKDTIIVQFNRENVNTASAIAQLNSKIQSLEQELANMRRNVKSEEVAQGGPQSHEMKIQIEHLTQQLQQATEKHKSDQQELESSKTLIASLKSQLSNHKTPGHIQKLHEANKQIQLQKLKLEELKKENGIFQDQIQNFDSIKKFLVQENRQLKINLHFMEQKMKEQLELQESGKRTLLTNPKSKVPSFVLYDSKKKGDAEKLVAKRSSPMTQSDLEKTPSFTRHRTVSSPNSPRRFASFSFSSPRRASPTRPQ